MTPNKTDTELWQAVREIAGGKKASPAIRDKLMFAAMSDLRDEVRRRVGELESKLGKIYPIYQALALLWVPVTLGLITLFITGKLVITRSP
jgi:hypothetical protein